MAYAPFDGVLLEDGREPIPGAVALLLHLRVARRRAGGRMPGLDAVKARAQACQELLAHGLLPERLRTLERFGLSLGDPRSAHSLASLIEHVEAYLCEVAEAGFQEPDEGLWTAVDRQLAGHRGLWIERGPEDGPLRAGLRDLQPARLRALACLPELGGAEFELATRKGDGSSGLFGSSQPLVDWFLDGLEHHGGSFSAEIGLREPEGWGEAPWAREIEGLFEGPLPLREHQDRFRRALVESPLDLLRHAVEQVGAWMDGGLNPKDITLIHPEPQRVASLLAPLLAAEGLALHVRGALPALIESEAWSPLWAVLSGLLRLDPCLLSAGLRASRRPELRRWAEGLAGADQNGEAGIQSTFMHLEARARSAVEAHWAELSGLMRAVLPARIWAERLEAISGVLRLPVDSEEFFAPMGLLKEVWGQEPWTFREMLTALRGFLEAARTTRVPRAPEGVRLVAPSTLVDGWEGAIATLVMDLSEGAWPARPASNPDLDWNQKAALNQALLAAAKHQPEAMFSPALQRFWLPRSEHGDQIPRAFQREAYAFNKVLAMTRGELVVLSPSQDGEGRALAQGPFWTALEGAGTWRPDPARAHSSLRWQWEGRAENERADLRAEASVARMTESSLNAQAAAFDRVPAARAIWLKGRAHASPTALEGLARCPFRSLAERGWNLGSVDAAGRFSMAVGTLAHRWLEAALTPVVGRAHWPSALMELLEADKAPEEALLGYLGDLWQMQGTVWLSELREVPEEQWPQLRLELESLLPNLAAYLAEELATEAPSSEESTLLNLSREGGWTRSILALEGELGPVDLDLGGGQSLAVAGKIDRLERWDHPSQKSFLRVVDTKTSRESSLGAFAEDGAPFGSHLQTPLYMLLAEAIHGLPATAALVPLREEEPKAFTKHLKRLQQEDTDGEGWKPRLLRNLARFDARLEEGDFPPTPGEHCARCQLSALCGRPVDVTAEGEAE